MKHIGHDKVFIVMKVNLPQPRSLLSSSEPMLFDFPAGKRLDLGIHSKHFWVSFSAKVRPRSTNEYNDRAN